MKRISLFFSLTIILIGCSTTKQGQTVSKRSEPARYETIADDTGFTASTCQIHDDEDYGIYTGLKKRPGKDDDQKVSDNKEAYDSLSINQEENKRKSKTDNDKLNNQAAHFFTLFMT